MSYKVSEFTEAEWDVLMYIASHIAGYQKAPSKGKVLGAGLEQKIVDEFLACEILREVNGNLQPVPETLQFPRRGESLTGGEDNARPRLRAD